MPATRELSWTHPDIDGQIIATVELEEKDGVYFTDQEPNFEITIKNDTAYDMNERSSVAWAIAIGQGRPEPFIREYTGGFEIPAGEERSVTGTDVPLSLEGHGIIALGSGRIDPHNGDGIQFTASDNSKEKYEPIATFSVWDREQYEVLHEQPQRTQHLALFASVGIVFFAVLQVATVLGYPKVGLLGGAGIICIYWRSGLVTELYGLLRETEN